MEVIYSLLTGLSSIVALAIIVGLIRPSLVVRWGEKRTRGRVLLYYGIGFMVLGSLAVTVMPDEVREEREQARLEQEREREQARLEREQARLERAREREQARLERERKEEQARLERERKEELAKIPSRYVDAPVLHREYRENEVSADNIYKGKLLRVSGVVKRVSKDAIGSGMIVYLKTGEYGSANVACRFSKEYKEELARLSVGQEVSIDGTCSGLTITTVYLRECTIFK